MRDMVQIQRALEGFESIFGRIQDAEQDSHWPGESADPSMPTQPPLNTCNAAFQLTLLALPKHHMLQFQFSCTSNHVYIGC